MSFWETVGGTRLANCLERTLPDIASRMSRTQSAIICKDMDEAIRTTQDYINKGFSFVGKMQSEKEILIIFEK